MSNEQKPEVRQVPQPAVPHPDSAVPARGRCNLPGFSGGGGVGRATRVGPTGTSSRSGTRK